MIHFTLENISDSHYIPDIFTSQTTNISSYSLVISDNIVIKYQYFLFNIYNEWEIIQIITSL